MCQSVLEETSGVGVVSSLVEPPRQVDELEIEGQRKEEKVPRGEMEGREGERNEDQAYAELERGASTQHRVLHAHHLVASLAVVLSDVPTQGAKVRKLPHKQHQAQQPCA